MDGYEFGISCRCRLKVSQSLVGRGRSYIYPFCFEVCRYFKSFEQFLLKLLLIGLFCDNKDLSFHIIIMERVFNFV